MLNCLISIIMFFTICFLGKNMHCDQLGDSVGNYKNYVFIFYKAPKENNTWVRKEEGSIYI
jgi:hypothetical protein